MIHIIITSYKEPKATLIAVNSFLKQKVKEDVRVYVVDPFPETETFLKENIKNERFKFILDPGEGKPYALNMIFEMFQSHSKNDILVFTDGDVYVSDNTLSEIIRAFKDKKVGGITGRPVSTNARSTKYGYWSKVVYDGIDKVRKKLDKKKEFMQCSGYLFAIRNRLVKETYPDVPEDCIIPYLIWKQGYRIAYLPKAEVYVQYPNNWSDWVKQRVRTIKAHENLNKLVPDMPRTKSLYNEIKKGLIFTITHPRNPKEIYWIVQLYFARLYIYYKSFKEVKVKKAFDPAWRDDSEIQSAKPMD
ncbi:glycosyltransferase family 2 protein [Candidatus Pacearchaeota archaeon]|nr:glycosyltransferase family 2 protein [Candidatus Pacearchaeota archaeon]